MSSTVGLAGWLGSSNLGDELIGSMMVSRLVELGLDPLAITVDPARTAVNLGVASIEHGRPGHTPQLAKSLRQVDGLVFGGGGLIQDETGPLNLPFHLGRLVIGRMWRKPWVGVGLGVGDVRRGFGKLLVDAAMRGSLGLTVRDPGSMVRLRAMGVTAELAADPVIAWPNVDPQPVDDVLAVIVRRRNVASQRTAATGPEPDADWLNRLVAVLDAASESTDLPIRLVAFEAEHDAALHRQLADRLATRVEIIEPGVDDVVAQVGRAQAVLTMRYHGAISALVTGRPAVMIDYSPKMADLSADLAGAMPTVPVELYNPAAVADALQQAIGRVDELAGHKERLLEREKANGRALERLAAAIS